MDSILSERATGFKMGFASHLPSFDLNAEEVASRTMASHGQNTGTRRGNTFVEGSMEFEVNPTNAAVWLQAGLMGTTTAGVTKVGKVLRPFTMEDGYTDYPAYRVITGVCVNTIGMSLVANQNASVTLGLVGKACSQWTATSIDSTPTAATTGASFFHDNGTARIGGSVVGTLNTLNWTWDNGLTPNFGLTSSAVSSFGIAPVRFLRGTVGGQMDNIAEVNKFITNADSSLQYTLPAGTDSLDVKISAVNYSGLQYSFQNGVLYWSANFIAKYSTADASSIVITEV